MHLRPTGAVSSGGQKVRRRHRRSLVRRPLLVGRGVDQDPRALPRFLHSRHRGLRRSVVWRRLNLSYRPAWPRSHHVPGDKPWQQDVPLGAWERLETYAVDIIQVEFLSLARSEKIKIKRRATACFLFP